MNTSPGDGPSSMPVYRLTDTSANDLGLLEHPAPNLEPGDVVILADGREVLVTASIESHTRRLQALLEVAVYSSGAQPR
jgi:hypothetical protein